MFCTFTLLNVVECGFSTVRCGVAQQGHAVIDE